MTRAPSVTLFAKREPTVTGTARYARRLAEELRRLGLAVRERRSEPPWPPGLAGQLRRSGLDVNAFWASYPLVPPVPRRGVLHLTSQTVATSIALVRPMVPTIVTVHDLIPYALRGDPRLSTLRHRPDALLYRLALRGLARADAVVCDSTYTADEVARLTRVPDARLHVVALGTDLPVPPPAEQCDEALSRAGIGPGARYVLYVGSEDPRKNLMAAIEAFARLAPSYPDLVFLKVGAAHHADERGRLRAAACRLGVGKRVLFTDQVSEADLWSLYARAAVAVSPSLFEGFGLPVLEAMAAGAPVVAADRSSLPEAAGDAAILTSPDPDGIARAVRRVLDDPALADDLRLRGRVRAARFSWRRTAEMTLAVYERVASAAAPAAMT